MFGKTFLCYLFARVCLSLASTVLSVTIGWHLYQATGDPFDLALVGLMQILPIIGLFIVTGWVVDNVSRKKVLVICAAAQMAVFAGLALVMMDGTVEPVWVYGLLFVNGCARAFNGPALQAVLPNIVARDQLSSAVAFTSTAWTAAMTAGPFVAGLLIKVLDFHTYGLLALLAFACMLSLLGLPTLRVAEKSQRGGQELLQGIRFVLANPIVMPSITLDLFIVLCGSVVALLPVFAVDVLNGGPEVLGLLRAMPALGAVVAGAILTRLPDLRASGQRLFVALMIFCGSILLFALSHTLWLSLLALFIYGASDMVSVNIRSTLIQIATPDDLRGRVSAVNSLFIASSNDLGDFRAGALAAAIGAVPAVLTGAGLAFVVTIAGWWRYPTLRRLDRLQDAEYMEVANRD